MIFFSISMHSDCQYWFAFTFRGKDAHLLICANVKPRAQRRYPPKSGALLEDTAFLQYVDNRLLCTPTEGQCVADTVRLRKHLVAEGHRGNLKKLHFLFVLKSHS